MHVDRQVRILSIYFHFNLLNACCGLHLRKINVSANTGQHHLPVAQLDRASLYESEGYPFDSGRGGYIDIAG